MPPLVMTSQDSNTSSAADLLEVGRVFWARKCKISLLISKNGRKTTLWLTYFRLCFAIMARMDKTMESVNLHQTGPRISGWHFSTIRSISLAITIANYPEFGTRNIFMQGLWWDTMDVRNCFIRDLNALATALPTLPWHQFRVIFGRNREEQNCLSFFSHTLPRIAIAQYHHKHKAHKI